ncbi:MAG: [FeFe] hydrogenase H-cluster radical SAM maturase HydE [Candidatus Wallbacteria bacterium]|nr:[FeFe] hydrogenase H-cluster radical SAM maturase HydE [Candidatus Wallbacteria bacterium]
MGIGSLLRKKHLDQADITELLSCHEAGDIEQLRRAAWETTTRYCGHKVHFRGLIEFSNICANDCLYCGIRKSNCVVERYSLTVDEVVEAAISCAEHGIGSLVLQSGERTDPAFIDFVVEIVEKIKIATRSDNLPQGMGITLCVGEQQRETCERFFATGAHRYLLRIETTSPDLYRRLHPPGMSLERRKACLQDLKAIGFQCGTGVMIGLPGQTCEDLARDILFFRDSDVDMIGMGPYIVHQDTPLAGGVLGLPLPAVEAFELSLRMIAVTRIVLCDINIAATTALQALHPTGREEGIRFGANVVMPQLTPGRFRKHYLLYDGKPCVDGQEGECAGCLREKIITSGREPGLLEWGDSPHFTRRKHG